MAWRDEMQRASFRGVQFYVKESTGALGRRNVIHQYPKKDTAYGEDLGKKAREFTLNDAFQVDKEGNISIGRVLGLRRLDIKDDKWESAMKAISDAIQVVGSKSYVRVYERVGDSEKWVAISLDVASVPVINWLLMRHGFQAR